MPILSTQDLSDLAQIQNVSFVDFKAAYLANPENNIATSYNGFLADTCTAA